MSLATAVGYGLAAYLVVGLATGIAFVAVGLGRALPEPAPFTLAARLILLPGATVLWPVVLTRWLKSKAQE